MDKTARLTSEDRSLDRADLERCLEHAQRLASLGTLAAGVAHEINNILTPVLSYAHLARSCQDDESMRDKAFEKIITGVEAACEVAATVLNYAGDREDSDQANVSETVAAALESLVRDPVKDGIEVKTRISPTLTVEMRPIALRQVLLNLFLNAASAMQGRRGQIRIEAEELGSDQVRLIVSDSGPGIPEHLMSTLFEPFVSSRNGERTGSSGGGSGLGLMVTRHLVEAASGSIAVESGDGQGAVFTITLPTIRETRSMAG